MWEEKTIHTYLVDLSQTDEVRLIMINETIMRLRVLAITVFIILGTFIFIDPAFAQGYPAYQCLLTSSPV
jgi:hypothetical protein